MSETVTEKKPTGNITTWIVGAFATAVSVMYLDARSDKEFLREQLKAANERADNERAERVKADQRTVDCHNLRAERAEEASEKAEKVYWDKKQQK